VLPLWRICEKVDELDFVAIGQRNNSSDWAHFARAVVFSLKFLFSSFLLHSTYLSAPRTSSWTQSCFFFGSEELSPPNMASNSTPSVHQVPSKRKRPGDEDWESASVKSDVFRIYISEAQSLDKTMTEIERLHGFKTTYFVHSDSWMITDVKCRKRKWKEMLKKWDFKKNIQTYDWQWMCSKRATRRTQEDKETVFHHRHNEITPEMLEEFENRKIGRAHAVNVGQ